MWLSESLKGVSQVRTCEKWTDFEDENLNIGYRETGNMCGTYNASKSMVQCTVHVSETD
jgi:hypothetical protein